MLKSLELFGFKSFADRTLFEFAPGVTCVVGPNGSGKSNVVDAIKWILGDQSAKSLRGKEMSDVIFNGSAGRRSSGFAEATLNFDNSEGLLPVDTAEVQIGRRLYQSGDSEYLLNRNPVRLKDIRDLFMGTGAGTAAYSIIEQGRVDQILQANPTTRRLVFEEAAGISKFKARRVDAERRLERVAQNLLRLTDIVDQVESQLNATRSQASKAARYRDVSAELRTAWTGLAADDSRRLSAALAESQAEFEQVSDDQNGIQDEVDAIEGQKREADGRLNNLEDEIRRRERAAGAFRQEAASLEATIRMQRQRQLELEADHTRQREQRFRLAKQVEFARSELATTSERLEVFAAQFDESERQLKQRQEELARLDDAAAERAHGLETQRQNRASVQQKREQLINRLALLESQDESLRQNLEQAKERLAIIQQQLETAKDEEQSRRRVLEESEAELQDLQDRHSGVQRAQGTMTRQREETDALLASLRERRSAATARLSVLEELEQRQEGIAIGVREILKRAETSHYPPWNRVLGCVRDLLDVPLDLAPIIDAALGERAQLLAVAELGPLLEYLNRGAPPIEGRVGFVSLQPTSFLPPRRSEDSDSFEVWQTSVDESTFDGIDGIYGRADQLVQERPRAKGLAERVLGDTWIVETLDVARQLMAQARPGTRAVTLQGELLSHSGELVVGTLPHESSIVSRKSELRQLKNEIQQLHRHIEDATQRQSILSENWQSQTEELDELGQDLKRLSNVVTQRATQLQGQVRELERLEQEQTQQQGTLDQLDERRRAADAEATEKQAELALVENELQELSALIGQEEQQLTSIRHSLQAAHESIKEEQLGLAKHEERLRGLRESQARLGRDQQQREQQWTELSQRVEELQKSRRDAELEALRAESRIAELMLRREQQIRDASGFYRQRGMLQQERAAIVKSEESLHARRRELVDRRHTLEFEIQKLRMQWQTLSERIEEEYQTSLEDLAASGVSAYQAFLEERYGTSAGTHTKDGDAESNESTSAEYGDAQSEEVAIEVDGAELETTESDAADELSESVLVPTFEEVREELEAQVDRLRRKIKMMGSVNTDALENLEELESQYETLSNQLRDLQEAKAALEDIIRRINQESQRIFLETFETIRGHFRELFRKLFGGGDADIILEDPEDVLECGIDIVARPPGKELRSISLLSGGEKTMTAVGLLFAMFKSKPSPYCVLDEVDAALDEANVDRYVSVVKEFVEMTQFVIITHRKRTMTAADVLYGVTMEQAGVSKRIAVKFEEVRDNGEIRTAA